MGRMGDAMQGRGSKIRTDREERSISIYVVALIALAIVLTIAAGLFAVGAVGGRRQKDPRNVTIAGVAFCLIVTGGLVGGTWGLARQIGTLITEEAALIALTLDAAFVGGLGFGRARALNKPSRLGALALVMVVLLAVGVGRLVTRNSEVISVVRQLDLDHPKPDYRPEKNIDCPKSLLGLYTALQIYSEDYDALPPAGNWSGNQDLISKVGQNEWLHCPAVSNRTDAKYGYAYNDAVAGRKLNGKKIKDLPDAARTPLLYDSSNLAINAHDDVKSLPNPGRHGGRDNILYCDGHVEAVEPK